MQKIHNEIRRVDAGILAAVRQQVIFVLFFPDRKQKLSFIALLILFVLIFHCIDLGYTALCSFSNWVHNVA